MIGAVNLVCLGDATARRPIPRRIAGSSSFTVMPKDHRRSRDISHFVTIFAGIRALLPTMTRRNTAVRAFTLTIHTPMATARKDGSRRLKQKHLPEWAW